MEILTNFDYKKIRIICSGDQDAYFPCPICSKNLSDELYKYDVLEESEVNWCSGCGILFDPCCTYGINGCAFDDDYVSFVKSFEYNGGEIEGMPIFKNIDILNEFFPKIKNTIYECPCPGYCPHDPKSFYPEYNGSCHRGCCKVKLSEEEKQKLDDIVRQKMTERRKRR